MFNRNRNKNVETVDQEVEIDNIYTILPLQVRLLLKQQKKKWSKQPN